MELEKRQIDKETKKNLIISRFIEMFALNVILSVIVAVLGMLEIVSNQWTMIAALSIALVVFSIINIGRCRWIYVAVNGEKDYYIINIVAYMAFALINIICIYILPNSIYTWMFLVTKLERFVLLGVLNGDSFWIGLLFSSIVFHVIGIGVILCAPLGLEWMPDEAPEDLKMLEIEENVNNENNDNEKEV